MVLYNQHQRVKIIELEEDLPVGSNQMVGIELGNGTRKHVLLEKVQLLDESDAEDSPIPSRTQQSTAKADSLNLTRAELQIAIDVVEANHGLFRGFPGFKECVPRTHIVDERCN